MPVTTKQKLRHLKKELDYRYSYLIDCLGENELKSNKEGLSKGIWSNPDSMCKTTGSTDEISIAVGDFKTILTEIKKLT